MNILDNLTNTDYVIKCVNEDREHFKNVLSSDNYYIVRMMVQDNDDNDVIKIILSNYDFNKYAFINDFCENIFYSNYDSVFNIAAQKDNLELIIILDEKYQFTKYDNLKLLKVSCEYGSLNIIRHLIKKNIDVKIRHVNLLLNCVFNNTRFDIIIFLNEELNINNNYYLLDKFKLFKVCCKYDSNMCKYIINVIKPNNIDLYLNDMIISCCKYNLLNIIKLIFKKYNTQKILSDKSFCHYLICVCCVKGHVEIIEYFINYLNFDESLFVKDKCLSLRIAYRNGHKNVADYISGIFNISYMHKSVSISDLVTINSY